MKPAMSYRVAVMFFLALIAAVLHAESGPWHDTFYQYRIPITLKIDNPGWTAIPLDEKTITAAINQLEELQYDPQFFAYNYVKLIEVDEFGNTIHAQLDSGFCKVPQGDKLSVTVREDNTGRREAMFEGAAGTPPNADKKDQVVLPVEPLEYYLLAYTSQGGGSSPAVNYEPVFPIGCRLRTSAVLISYESRLLPQAPTRQQTLLLPDSGSIMLRFDKSFTTNASDVSLQKVKILFLAHMQSSGIKHFHLYYQPMCSLYLMTPEREHPAIPENRATIQKLADAEKYFGTTRYLLTSNEYLCAWFGESTVKLTPNTPPPANTQASIHLSSAKNEKQSFQLILRAQRPLHFEGVSAADLKMANTSIPAANIAFRALDYMPILRTSYVTPARYIGLMADPLVGIHPGLISPDTGNYSIWTTIQVPPDTAAGIYEGTLAVQTKECGQITLSLKLTVHDFCLPEYSPFQTDMGGSSLYKSSLSPISNTDYHGVKTKADMKKLADAYFEEMAVNKFTPSNCALFTEVGVKWTPPPQGYNVDAPGNYFKLYDWDFTEYNQKLDYFINQLKVNQICIYHTSPLSCSSFYYLPTEKLETFNRRPPYLVMGSQLFSDSQFFAYDFDEKHPSRAYEGTIGITRDQFDHLLLDYLRGIAENLDKHGWLDYATIMCDEGHHEKWFLHFLRVLKSDPLVSRIRVGVCMQGQSYLYYKENPTDTDFAYRNLLDYYIPEINENYNRWEDCFWDDYNIVRDRKKLMPYGVTTARSAIDVPGMTNRVLPMDIFRRGGSGYLIWATFHWPHAYKDWQDIHPVIENPWLDPFGRHGNGALSFFYPPRKNGFAPEPDFTITPSVRVMMWREAVDDYEYAWILEQTAAQAQAKGVDISSAKTVFEDINRFFYNSVHWSQNDAWYLDLRERIAAAIIELREKLQ